ncbi:DUF2141 domain-containing protein [Flagellimonas taeanensis]|jgi:uncharacterized protein (DUF2141 family)|uniref:DUF2141 domain-containing protein n=1 Tax=Flavobacteriaceae TaxID=49546 RepID=UPI000E68F162|nr:MULTISPECIES: DUF2141 domain-containing protein [Allomuricauda]MDC6383799.1 DUF2141 domain-containing protein [Muricauda sp. SK9]RIV48426.1 DUF2141 domain-containing protein [Allomuricauda taeanensis]
MRGILFCTLVLPLFVFSQNTISVHVNNVGSDIGHVNVAVYDSDEAFLSFDRVLRTGTKAASKGLVTLDIEDLPAGEYALAVFHDENGNGKLDTNWLGIPKEKVAFSNAKMKTFGPPKYKECAFKVTADHEISIDL